MGRSRRAGCAALTPAPRVPQAVYVEMTFFDVNSAESAANKAIQGLEAKGWQAEIVDPEDMGAPRRRAAGAACDARADAVRRAVDDDEEYDEEGEEEEEK